MGKDHFWQKGYLEVIMIVTSESTPSPNATGSNPNWQSIFPDADHRWVMGVRRGDAPAFFSPRDPTGRVRAERQRWLTEDPERYAALTPTAEPALADTVALAQQMGVTLAPTLTPWEQLMALGRTWEADFVWMHPDETGAHRLTGGVVCFPSSWALRDKLGRTMSETHRPVPGLNAALDRQIETFFAKMIPGVAWTRENANYSRVPDLNQHPVRPRPPLDATVTGEEFLIRLEHQLLLKFPASGSILFAIRVEVFPLSEVLNCAEGSARLARLLDTMSVAAAEYKGIAQAREVIVPLLRSLPLAKSEPQPHSESDTAPDPARDVGLSSP